MRLLDDTVNDLRYALRSMRREPVLVTVIVATFAIAIGANSAMYGLVSRLMLAPPPGVHDAGRVVRVERLLVTDDGTPYTMATTSYPAFQAIASLDRVYDAAAAVRTDSMVVGRGADATRIAVVQASGRYFEVLGAHPARGRYFGAADDELPIGSPVVVLGDAFWKRRFGADPSVLGREIVVDDQPMTVIGIAPPNFNGDGVAGVDAYVPLSAAMRNSGSAWYAMHGVNLVSVLARLRGDVRPDDAGRTTARAIVEAGQVSGGVQDYGVALESLQPGAAARQSAEARVALWLAGVSLVVLLIATANVATLLLLRALRRRREIGVRLALGVGRGRLARQLLGESLLLALVGAAAGLLLSRWLADLVRATLLPTLAPSEALADGRVLAAALAAAVVAGLVAGLAPLGRTAVRNIAAELGAGELGGSGRSRTHGVLVATQVALCTLLLVGAGLFVRSLWRVQSQDLGYSTRGLLLVELEPRVPLDGRARDALYADAVRRLTTVPGVRAATVVSSMPFAWHFIPPISVPGRAEPPGAEHQLPIMYGATPTYLSLMHVRTVAGRLFTDEDRRGSPMVVLVNESMAREVWPGESAIGKCIRIGFDPTQEPSPLAPATLPCREVVGVVRDSRARLLRADAREASLMQYYVPFEQLPAGGGPQGESAPKVNGLLIGANGTPAAVASAVQRVIQGTSTIPVFASVSPYQSRFERQLRPWRMGATLFTALGALALAIAAVGLFGVVSYVAQRRTREMGIRLALGATDAEVRAVVVTGALRLTTVGVVAGLSAALALSPLIASMLFQTSPREWSVLVVAGVSLLAVAVVAAAVPAWRTGRVSPMVALRE